MFFLKNIQNRFLDRLFFKICFLRFKKCKTETARRQFVRVASSSNSLLVNNTKLHCHCSVSVKLKYACIQVLKYKHTHIYTVSFMALLGATCCVCHPFRQINVCTIALSPEHNKAVNLWRKWNEVWQRLQNLRSRSASWWLGGVKSIKSNSKINCDGNKKLSALVLTTQRCLVNLANDFGKRHSQQQHASQQQDNDSTNGYSATVCCHISFVSRRCRATAWQL